MPSAARSFEQKKLEIWRRALDAQRPVGYVVTAMSVLRKLRTFAFIAKEKPAQAWELLQIRAERKIGVSLFMFSVRRTMTYAFEALRTNKLNGELRPYGNYFLAPSLLPKKPIVFSLGVGQDISFDRALIDKHDVHLFLFDPTPASARYIEGLHLPTNVSFTPLAVTDYDGDVALFSDDIEQDFAKTASVSIFNRGYFKSSSTVPCRKIKTLMRERGIDHLDVLKMDIEGAAIQVLEDLLRDEVYPGQIACEFERPEKIVDVYAYLRRLSRVFNDLEAFGYQLYRTRPSDKGCQIEILAIRG